jgi:hypothetical protein
MMGEKNAEGAPCRRFAGENYETAVLHPKAHGLLSRYTAKSEHFEVRITPE